LQSGRLSEVSAEALQAELGPADRIESELLIWDYAHSSAPGDHHLEAEVDAQGDVVYVGDRLR
jgi:hypothetical protein